MSSSAMLSALFGFNQAMNERLWTIIMEHLTDAQFAQVDSYSRGSIRNQFVHMAEAQYYWLRSLLEVHGLPELSAEDYSSRSAARTVCQQADQEILNRVRGLSESDLEHIPDRWSQPVWVGLLQNANHAIDHRAQILRALNDFGAPTFDQNFSDYMENATPMTVEGLIRHISNKRAVWDEMLKKVVAEHLDEPLLDDWKVRDVIAIITWKEHRLMEIIRTRVFTGLSFGELPEEEETAILETSRAMSLPALLEQHHVTYHEMLDMIQSLTDEDVNSEHIDGLPPDVRLWKLIAVASWWSYPTFSGLLRQLLEKI